MLVDKLLQDPIRYKAYIAVDNACGFIGCLWAEGIVVNGKSGPADLQRLLDERKDSTQIREWIVRRGVVSYSVNLWKECFISIVKGQ